MTCRAVTTAARLTPQLGAGGQTPAWGHSCVFPCGLAQASGLTFPCYFVKQRAVGPCMPPPQRWAQAQ